MSKNNTNYKSESEEDLDTTCYSDYEEDDYEGHQYDYNNSYEEDPNGKYTAYKVFIDGHEINELFPDHLSISFYFHSKIGTMCGYKDIYQITQTPNKSDRFRNVRIQEIKIKNPITTDF